MEQTPQYTLAQLQEMENDPQLARRCQQRAERISGQLHAKKEQMQALANMANRAPTAGGKLGGLRAIAELVADATSGYTACSNGCSHCCHIPVLVSRAEAEVIGTHIGRPPADTAYSTKANPAYTGTPCPFLAGGRCSIYEDRPLACRNHYSVADNGALCDTRHGVLSVPYFNLMTFTMVQLQVFGLEASMQLADLRDFWPQGLGAPA